MILGNRYRIKQELGQGGFGRTYLVEDLYRFNEHCVLKEFAPQVRGTSVLQKAKELFEREAGVLYRLQHPQIPKFRELFQTKFADQSRLFLVQDYIEGLTYRQLLDIRRAQGCYFSEPEIRQLLSHLLPVLQYLHSVGVIHRDISPENIILRYSDKLPVLIDFGAVKQVAAIAMSEYGQLNYSSSPTATRLGKMGYAPDEQMQMGDVFPHSDLYALAVTVLVKNRRRLPAMLPKGGNDRFGLAPSWQQFSSGCWQHDRAIAFNLPLKYYKPSIVPVSPSPTLLLCPYPSATLLPKLLHPLRKLSPSLFHL
jgi:serine/threonine protein kinase, bacterial